MPLLLSDNDEHDELLCPPNSFGRREFLSLPLVTAFVLSQAPSSSDAVGLVQFPQTRPYANTYNLLRAGTSIMEEQDIWSTNPLFLTNREDALSSIGQEQIIAACREMKRANQSPTIVRYGLAASSIDTIDIVGRELKVGRERLQAEFTFLDPRAIGKWDMLRRSETLPAVWAMDEMEAGADGTGARPPPNDDGTPHETLADQGIRLRQLLSLLETQFSGDTILLVFRDGTGPAVLSALMAGIPLNRVHELEFAPGELRIDVRMDTVQTLWKSKLGSNNTSYQETLAVGREKLAELRSTDSFVNMKDQRLERERLALEEAYNKDQALKRKLQQEKLEQERQERRAIEEEYERERALQRQLKQEKLERQREERQQERAAAEGRQNDNSRLQSQSDQLGDSSNGVALAGGAASVLAVILGTQATGNSTAEEVGSPLPAVSNNNDNSTTTAPTAAERTKEDNATVTAVTAAAVVAVPQPTNGDNVAVATKDDNATTATTAVAVPQLTNGDLGATFEVEVTPSLDPYTAAQKAMEDYINQDDGGDAWLSSLYQIINEEDALEETENKPDQ